MRNKVVIIGHSYTSRLSLIRAVATEDCEVIVVVMNSAKERSSRKPIDAYSKYVNQILYCARKDEAGLISLLMERCKGKDQKTILIPDGDDVVAAIDNHKEELQPFFMFPYITKEPCSMQYWMDKSHQKNLAREVGLNVPGGCVVDIIEGHYSIPDHIHYPCYSKPLATMNGGKGGMRRCDNLQELEEALDYIAQNRSMTIKVLVEDYKQIDTEYALLGFSDGKEVIIPAILQFIDVSKQNKGIALRGKVLPITGFESLLEQFKQLVLRIGFVGVFDIDFYKSDGIIYFCELNLRYGGSGYAITKMGVNLPAMMVRCFLKEPYEDMNKYVAGEAVYVNDRMCIADWDKGYLSKREVIAIMKSADIRFVPDKDDVMPEKRFNKVFKKRSRIIWMKGVVAKFRKRSA